MEFVAPSSLLKKLIQSLHCVADEATLSFEDRDLVGQAVDESNSSMVWTRVSSDNLEISGEDGEQIAIATGTLHKILKTAPATSDVYWKDDPSTISLRIGQHRHVIPKLAFSALRRVPKSPEIPTCEASVGLSGEGLKSALKMAGRVSEAVTIKASPDGFMMWSEEMGETFEFELKAEDLPSRNLPQDGEVTAIYSVSLLEALKAIYGAADMVRLLWSDEKPLKMSFESEPGLLTFYYLAPRAELPYDP